MTGTRAIECQAADLIAIGGQQVPPESAADGKAEGACVDPHGLAASGQSECLRTARRRFSLDRDTFDDLRGAKSRLAQGSEDARGIGLPMPRPTGPRAVGVVMAAQVGRGKLRPDGARVFGPSAAIARVIGGGRFALEPEQLAGGAGDGLFDARGDGGQVEALAVSGRAQVVAFSGMAATEFHGVGTGGDGDRFQGLVGAEDTALSGDDAGDVALQGQFAGGGSDADSDGRSGSEGEAKGKNPEQAHHRRPAR